MHGLALSYPTLSYIEQMTLILETVGTPDEETMARVASEKVRNSSGKTLHHVDTCNRLFYS